MLFHRGSVELRDRDLEQHLTLARVFDGDRVHLGDAVLVPEDQARIAGLATIDEDVPRADENDVRNLRIADGDPPYRAIELDETALARLDDERRRRAAQVIVIDGRRRRHRIRLKRIRLERIRLHRIHDALLRRYRRGSTVRLGAQRARRR